MVLWCRNAFSPAWCIAWLRLKLESPGMLSQVLRNLSLTWRILFSSLGPVWETGYRCNASQVQIQLQMLVLFLGDLSSTRLLWMVPTFCDPSTLMDFLESVFMFSWTLQHLSNFHLINDTLKDIFQQGNRFLPREFPLWSSVMALSFSKIEVFFFIGCNAWH